MFERKIKPISNEELIELKNTIDVIDISIYDLLKKRMELSQQINKITNSSLFDVAGELASSIQKITAARKYDTGILLNVVGLIKAMAITEKNLTIGIVTGKDNLAAIQKILATFKTFFPLFSTIDCKLFAKYIDVIGAIYTSKNIIVSIPAVKTNPKDVWWMAMLTPEKQNVKIIEKYPMIDNTDENNSYMIANVDKYFGFDRSVIVIATSENITDAWLKTALHRIKIPLYNIIDSTAVFNGTVLHMLEISYPIQNESDSIFKLNETIDNINIRIAGYLGGYFLPIVEKDKIVEFNQVE